MKKRFVVLVLVLMLIMTFTSCGARYSDKEVASMDNSYYQLSSGDYSYDGNIGLNEEVYNKADIYNNPNTKLIYRANITLQTEQFESVKENLYNLLSELSGYVESSRVNNGEMNYSSSRTAYYTFRVPTENYDKFVQGIEKSCHVLNLQQDIEDIGQAYFEAESHIATLKIKIGRFQDLLKEATNMSDIIELTNALSAAENELEQYEGTLNRYDSLINYSTIDVTILEVGESINGENDFFSQVHFAFLKGFNNFVGFLEKLVYFFARNIIVILILVIVFIVLNAKFKWTKKTKESSNVKDENVKPE